MPNMQHIQRGDVYKRLSSAAAAAKSLQSCPTLCNPIDGSPPGCSVHRILQARILEWVAISLQHMALNKYLIVSSILDISFRGL